MALDLPTLDEIHDELLEAHRARLPDDDISRNSDAWKRTRVVAGALYGVYRKIQVAEDAIFPDTAEGDELDRHGTIYGVTRKAATPARKSSALRVYGTAASTVSIGDELTHTNGLRYQVNENGTIPASPLYVDVDIVAIDTGEQTKLDSGEELTFSSPPAGIDSIAELQLDLDEDGTDQESDGAYRTRILRAISQPAGGGNANDYRSWALESDDTIASAYVYPLRRGRGSVDLAALHAGTGSVRLLTSDERDDLFDYVDALRPVHVKAFRVLEVQADTENVEVKIEPTPGTAYAFDWDDETAPLVVAWTAATRTLQMTTGGSAVIPDDMKRGDRIVIKTVAGNGDGIPLEVEATADDDATLGADEVRLLTAPTTAPVANDVLYAGGPLTAAIRTAIVDMFDEFGPAVGSFGTGEWVDELTPNRVAAAAFGVAGVRDVTVVTPAATVTPAGSTYPTDTTVDLLVPQEVVVRKEW
jgi:uncharacterized phage protein gp47/JayE